MDDIRKISIVSPVYMAENILDELVDRISNEIGNLKLSFEIILVEDASPDNSWKTIEKICLKHNFVKGIKLSRNFGQHYAITAGVEASNGNVVVLMDCDLQDSPSDIKFLLDQYYNGFDIVFTTRIDRKHNFFKKVLSRIYQKSFRLFSDKRFDVNMGSLVLFSSRVRDAFLKVSDQDRLYIQILKWVGFRSTIVRVEHNERYSGKSSYTFIKMMRMAIEGWTFHSERLLRMSIYMGFTLSVGALIGILFILISYFTNGYQSGWASIFVLILFNTGVIQLSIGILGIYLAKIFKQVKNRPLYIIEETLNGR
jgi:polyisoprenyl-phosphate glycosyltransferase